MRVPRSADVRRLSITRVDRDRALLAVLERQLLSFYDECKDDGALYDKSTVDAVELRMALANARAENVGTPREFVID